MAKITLSKQQIKHLTEITEFNIATRYDAYKFKFFKRCNKNYVDKHYKISLDKEYFVGLEKKAGFLDELLSFIEDESLGYLMEETEKEENIPLFKVKKIEW